MFTPERWILRFGGWRLVPAGYNVNPDPTRNIWSPKEIPKDHLLPISTKICKSFQIVDTHLKNKDGETSYIDVAFGNPSLVFAGCHRFSIERLRDENGVDQVEVTLMHFRCNPREDRVNIAEPIAWFHKLYACVLFLDGLRSVLRN